MHPCTHMDFLEAMVKGARAAACHSPQGICKKHSIMGLSTHLRETASTQLIAALSFFAHPCQMLEWALQSIFPLHLRSPRRLAHYCAELAHRDTSMVSMLAVIPGLGSGASFPLSGECCSPSTCKAPDLIGVCRNLQASSFLPSCR